MEVEIKNITKKFGKKTVLNGISLKVSPGKCIGILGENGSGKSTLLGILSGIVKSDSGDFLLDGKSMLKNTKFRSFNVGYVPQGTPLFPELTAKENLMLWYDSSVLKRELSSGVLKMLGIDEFLNIRVSRMSGGMKKRLSIGCAIHSFPRILLLDEPSAALDLVCKESVLNYLNEFRKQGGMIILATHDIPEVEFCDETYIMKDGLLNKFDYNGNVHDLVNML